MKKLIYALLAVFVSAFLFTGCVDNPCDSVICLNGSDGTCIDGDCTCLPGYEDADCGTVTVLKILGNWEASGTCVRNNDTTFIINYFTSIDSVDANVAQANIFNFGGFGENLEFTTNVNGDSITMPLSDPYGTGELLEGIGAIASDGNTIDWTYTLEGDGFLDECSETWTKQ